MKRFLLRILLPLILGLIIYVIFSPNAYITKFIWNIMNIDNPFREADIIKMPFIVKLLRYYLCDILWSFSFTNMLMLVLGNKNAKKGFYIAIVFSTIIELLQIDFIGTFDIWDIIVQALGCFLAFLINRKTDQQKCKEEAGEKNNE